MPSDSVNRLTGRLRHFPSPSEDTASAHNQGELQWTAEDCAGPLHHENLTTAASGAELRARAVPVTTTGGASVTAPALDKVRAGLTTLSDLPVKQLERLRARFEAKTTPEPMSGCLLWIGALSSAGYGNIGVGSRGHGTAIVRAAHRVAWLLERGDLPENVVLDHRCRNTACVNVRHLEPVSHQVNVARGNVARLTAATKSMVIVMLAQGRAQREVAAELGLSQSYVSRLGRARRAA